MIFDVTVGGVDACEHVDELRALLLASQRFRQAIAERFGMGLREVVVLGHLAHSGEGLTPSQLANRMLLRSGTLTAILDRLAARGYLRRRPNSGDRRSSVVLLTTSGRRVVRTVNKQLELVITAAAHEPSATDSGLHLTRLAAALYELADQQPAPARS